MRIADYALSKCMLRKLTAKRRLSRKAIRSRHGLRLNPLGLQSPRLAIVQGREVRPAPHGDGIKPFSAPLPAGNGATRRSRTNARLGSRRPF